MMILESNESYIEKVTGILDKLGGISNSKILIIIDNNDITELEKLGAVLIFKPITDPRLFYNDNSFEYIISCIDLCCMERKERLQYLAELYRVVKVGGKIYNYYGSSEEINTNELIEALYSYDDEMKEISDYDKRYILIKEKKAIRVDKFNISLTKELFNKYLNEFGKDQVFIDLIMLDDWAITNDLPIVSSGRSDDRTFITQRSFRIWEYRQLIKALKLDKAEKLNILDLGGASCTLTFYAGLKGHSVISLDINPVITKSQQEVIDKLGLKNMQTELQDMSDLSKYPDNTFDCVMSASVYEHLKIEDQIKSIIEVFRVLKPGGICAISIDYGIPAPNANEDLVPYHEPAMSSYEIYERYVKSAGFEFIGDSFTSEIYPYWENVYYTPAVIVMKKPNDLKESNLITNDFALWKVENSICNNIDINANFINIILELLLHKTIVDNYVYTLKKDNNDRLNNIYRLTEANSEKENDLISLNKLVNEKDKAITELNRLIKEKDKAIIDLNDMFKEKDEAIINLNNLVKEKDKVLLKQDKLLKDKENVIIEKDKEILELNSLVKNKDEGINYLNSVIEGLNNKTKKK